MTVLIVDDDILPLLNLSPSPSPTKRGEKDKAIRFLVYGFDNDIVVVNGIRIEKGDQGKSEIAYPK